MNSCLEGRKIRPGCWEPLFKLQSGLLSLMTTPICSTHHSAQMKILSTEIYRDVQGIEFVVNLEILDEFGHIFGH